MGEKPCEHRGQLVGREGFPQDRSAGVAVRHMTTVACREEIWHPLRGEHVCHGVAVGASKVHIQYGGVEDLPLNQSDGLIDCGGSDQNTLATVQSIVWQALRANSEPKVIRDSIEPRLLALSRSI
jgi:hypothetical protein